MEAGARKKSNTGRQGFGKLILTTVVPAALSGSANWVDNDDGVVWHLSIHPKLFTVAIPKGKTISDSLVPREAVIPLNPPKTKPWVFQAAWPAIFCYDRAALLWSRG